MPQFLGPWILTAKPGWGSRGLGAGVMQFVELFLSLAYGSGSADTYAPSFRPAFRHIPFFPEARPATGQRRLSKFQACMKLKGMAW